MEVKKKVIKVFHSPGCEPCHPLVKAIDEGNYSTDIEGAEVHVIDVSTDEGFPEVEKEDVDSVPSAKYRGKTCHLGFDEDGLVVISCKKGR